MYMGALTLTMSDVEVDPSVFRGKHSAVYSERFKS